MEKSKISFHSNGKINKKLKISLVYIHFLLLFDYFEEIYLLRIAAKGESPFAAEDKRLEMKRAISLANSKAIVHDYEIDNAKNGITKCEFCNSSIKKDEVCLYFL